MTAPEMLEQRRLPDQAEVAIRIPYDPDAEGALLGAAMSWPKAHNIVANLVDKFGSSVCWDVTHSAIAAAMARLHREGVSPADSITLRDELRRAGEMTPARELRILEVLSMPNGNAERYAQIVERTHIQRQHALVGEEIKRAGMAGEDVAPYISKLAALAVPPIEHRSRLLPVSEFLQSEEMTDAVLLGRGNEVLHAQGEATFVVAVTGAGKSTFAQGYALHRAGLNDGPFVGFDVKPLAEAEAILYVAADRPKQIQRSLGRMVRTNQVDELDRKVFVWRGPLPYLLNAEPPKLLAHVREMERDLGVKIVEVIIDSLKDVALDLAKDEGGSGVAQAINALIAGGVDAMVLHHERKPERGAKKAPADISDVYGSTFLTAGAGNVIYLHGPAGAHVVILHHLKQSGEQVGPLPLEHDHDTGAFSLHEKRDLLAELRRSANGMSVKDACEYLFDDASADKNTQARAYRQLERLVKQDPPFAYRRGSTGFSRQARYYALAESQS